MRVLRGKSYEAKRGVWEKIEVELDSNDLLPDEQTAPLEIQVQLLELRADRNIVLFMRRAGKLTKEEAEDLLAELSAYRKTLMSLKPQPELRLRSYGK